MDINLKCKYAIVCGSTRGIGRAIAAELAVLGANVILFARDAGAMKKVLPALDQSQGQQHGFLEADFRFPDQVLEVIADFAKKNSTLDILVNNSGGRHRVWPLMPIRTIFLNAFPSTLFAINTLFRQ
jgi:3-oxoacyl-[acyl-carrier protein] reductase